MDSAISLHIEQNRPTKAGTVELQMSKNFTPEEEDREVMAFFKEIERDFGFRNIHTIRVVPDDVRQKTLLCTRG